MKENIDDKLQKLEEKVKTNNEKMTQEQANAVMNIAKDTKAFIGVKLSQKANDLIENDKVISEKFDNLAEDTVTSSMETFATDNKKQGRKNFFELNEKDVISLGGDKSSTHGQQFSIVMIKRFFWILFMATLGTFFIAPLSVIIELFQGISFKNIEKEEYSNGDNKQVKWVVHRHKLGIAGTIFGWIIGLAFCGLEVFLITIYPFVFMYLAIAVFIVLLLTNLLLGINPRNIRKILRKADKGEVSDEIEIDN